MFRVWWLLLEKNMQIAAFPAFLLMELCLNSFQDDHDHDGSCFTSNLYNDSVVEKKNNKKTNGMTFNPTTTLKLIY